MNSNVVEIAVDKRDESICLDLNESSLSDINMRNMSFYSYNDHAGNELRHSSLNDVTKSRSAKKSEVEPYKMLPYYIEKVSKNIQYLDDLIKKQNTNPESQNVLNTSTATPAIENLNTLIKKSVDSVNEVLATNKIVLEKLDKKKLIHTNKTANLSLDSRTLLKLAKTGKNFDVIDEKDEDVMNKKDLMTKQDLEVGLKSARNVKKSLLTLPLSPLKKFGTSTKIVANKSYNTNNFSSNNSMLAKYKTTNTSINNYTSANSNKPISINQPPKTGLYVNRNGRNSAKDIKSNYKAFMTTNTLPNKDASQQKKSLNTSKLSAQIKAANIVKKPLLTDQRQNSMSNIRKSFASTNVADKLDMRRVLSPTPYRTEPNRILAALIKQKDQTNPKQAGVVRTSLNTSHISNNHSINSGVKPTSKCSCLCTCNYGMKNTSHTIINNNKHADVQSSLVNNNTTTVTELNSRILTTANPHFSMIDNGTELKMQIKKLCGMYLINSEYNAYKNNNFEKDTKLLSFIKSTLKSIDEESEANNKHNSSNLSSSNNYNSNHSNPGGVMIGDRRKELNKRRDEIKVWRIVQIQRKWREFLMKKNLGLNNFSLKTQIKSETIKLCKEKIFSLFKDTTQEKLIEMIHNMNKANELWNEINENSCMIIDQFI